jgi:hypothetical protein
VPAHQELAKREAAGETLPAGAAIPIAGPPSEDEPGDDEAVDGDEAATEPTNESDIAIVEDSIDVAPIAEADEPGHADEVAPELIAEPAVEAAAATEETDQPA